MPGTSPPPPRTRATKVSHPSAVKPAGPPCEASSWRVTLRATLDRTAQTNNDGPLPNHFGGCSETILPKDWNPIGTRRADPH